MRGSHRIQIENKRLKYDFVIKRNLTVIRGNSATGKTTMVAMLQAHEADPEGSGIDIISDKPCVVLTTVRWQENLASIQESIVFVDEGGKFICSREFAEAVARSTNYFVLITRERLENLPYSVDEIYGIRVSQKYMGLKKTYNELYKIYYPQKVTKPADVVVTEDSNSGFQFFSKVFAGKTFLSAEGKSNIVTKIRELGAKNVLVIADGAAFGPEMEHMSRLISEGISIILYLPESFEWLILKSDLLRDSEIREILNAPEGFIDSEKYISWERFFTLLLIDKTSGTYLEYKKSRLNPMYLRDNEMKRIREVIPEELFEV